MMNGIGSRELLEFEEWTLTQEMQDIFCYFDWGSLV